MNVRTGKNMKGIVIMNAYPNGEKFYRQSERIARALKAAGAEAEVVLNGSLSLFVGADGRIRGARDCDFAVYLDKDKYLGRMLEKTGLRLFNRAEAVERCDDKMLTYLALSESGLCVPETIAAPLCYTPGVQADERFLASVAERLSFPLVVKKSFGSFGKDVRLVYDREALKETAQEFLYCPHFYQRYIAESAGRDIRVVVIGGKAVGAMERRAKAGEFRSNIELGGKGGAVALKEDFRLAAERAANVLGLDYCGVDLLESERGPVLCEVNSNAFFEGLEAAAGIDVAKLYAEYIADTMRRMGKA